MVETIDYKRISRYELSIRNNADTVERFPQKTRVLIYSIDLMVMGVSVKRVKVYNISKLVKKGVSGGFLLITNLVSD